MQNTIIKNKASTKKVTNVLKKILATQLITLTCISSLGTPKVQAKDATNDNKPTSVSDLQSMVVDFAETFLSDCGSKCIYPESGRIYAARETTYEKGVKDVNDNYYNSYTFDCVGWVDFAVHFATGLNSSKGLTAYQGIFVTPHETAAESIKEDKYLKEVDINDAEGGDLLIAYRDNNENGRIDDDDTTHVAICIGNGEVIDMWGNAKGGLGKRKIKTDSSSVESSEHFIFAARFTDAAVKDASGPTTIGGGTSITGGPSNITKGQSGTSSDVIDPIIVNLDEADFKFSGNPETVKYKGKKSVINQVYSVFSEFIDYLFGLVTIAVKMAVIGWGNIIEALITMIIDQISPTA